jgi:hypothetical protein
VRDRERDQRRVEGDAEKRLAGETDRPRLAEGGHHRDPGTEMPEDRTEVRRVDGPGVDCMQSSCDHRRLPPFAGTRRAAAAAIPVLKREFVSQERRADNRCIKPRPGRSNVGLFYGDSATLKSIEAEVLLLSDSIPVNIPLRHPIAG